MLPRRIPKVKRESRWRSPAHLGFVRGFACAKCGSTVKIEAAHVRNGSGAGIGQKPDDWRAVPLCGSSELRDGCHQYQHHIGEQTFWREYAAEQGQTVEQLIAELIAASPKRREIEIEQSSREPGPPNKRPGQGQ